jgi:hypothetical protein
MYLRPHLYLFSAFILLMLTVQSGFAQHKFGKALMPDKAIVQYAGSIGYMSVGLGYDLFKERAELSFHYGYVPQIKGGELHIGALKFEYKPFKLKISDGLIFRPVNPVVFGSYTFGSKFGLRFNPDQYPKGYYFWSPALRGHLGATSELEILANKTSSIRSITLFTEANTNDLYMVSWYENRTTTPITKIFNLGFGLKLGF